MGGFKLRLVCSKINIQERLQLSSIKDAEIFLSTSITLQLLADRIVPGTHMIVDEIFVIPGYKNHEILAPYL